MFIFMFVCMTLPHTAIVIMEMSEIKDKGLCKSFTTNLQSSYSIKRSVMYNYNDYNFILKG